MNTKHTSGPWTPSPYGAQSVWKGNKQIAACLWVDENGKPNPVCIGRGDEGEANANLIAAAPELLSALDCAAHSFQAVLSSLTPNQRHMAEVSIRTWNEIIAKAEGK